MATASRRIFGALDLRRHITRRSNTAATLAQPTLSDDVQFPAARASRLPVEASIRSMDLSALEYHPNAARSNAYAWPSDATNSEDEDVGSGQRQRQHDVVDVKTVVQQLVQVQPFIAEVFQSEQCSSNADTITQLPHTCGESDEHISSTIAPIAAGFTLPREAQLQQQQRLDSGKTPNTVTKPLAAAVTRLASSATTAECTPSCVKAPLAKICDLGENMLIAEPRKGPTVPALPLTLVVTRKDAIARPPTAGSLDDNDALYTLLHDVTAASARSARIRQTSAPAVHRRVSLAGDSAQTGSSGDNVSETAARAQRPSHVQMAASSVQSSYDGGAAQPVLTAGIRRPATLTANPRQGTTMPLRQPIDGGHYELTLKQDDTYARQRQASTSNGSEMIVLESGELQVNYDSDGSVTQMQLLHASIYRP